MSGQVTDRQTNEPYHFHPRVNQTHHSRRISADQKSIRRVEKRERGNRFLLYLNPRNKDKLLLEMKMGDRSRCRNVTGATMLMAVYFFLLLGIIVPTTTEAAFVVKGSSATTTAKTGRMTSPVHIGTVSNGSPTARYAAAKKGAAAKKSSKTAVESVKKSELIASIAEKLDVTKSEGEDALDAVVATITENVLEGKKVPISGFGTFVLKERAARKGRNPQTGEELDIPASKNPSFTASKKLKELANE